LRLGAAPHGAAGASLRYLCNLPRAINWLWTHICAPLLPARVKEKTGILDTSVPGDRAMLERHLRLEKLPGWVGGGWRQYPPSWDWLDAALQPLDREAGSADLAAANAHEGFAFRRYDEPGFELATGGRIVP
jgi:hypothetical protein